MGTGSRINRVGTGGLNVLFSTAREVGASTKKGSLPSPDSPSLINETCPNWKADIFDELLSHFSFQSLFSSFRNGSRSSCRNILNRFRCGVQQV